MGEITATEFKAKCLDLLDRVARHDIGPLSITKHGRVVAQLIAPPTEVSAIGHLHGFMRGSALVPDTVDLTSPVLDAAARGPSDPTS